ATKLTRLTTKLDRETITGRLVWSTKPIAGLDEARAGALFNIHEATYNGVRIRAFRGNTIILDITGVPTGSQKRNVLQFINDAGAVEWEASDITGLDELLETIEFKTHKIADKIDAILAA
ncbi:MAG: hypothetical protein WCK65_07275, partial [Rhodospirillaceae bacterium]